MQNETYEIKQLGEIFCNVIGHAQGNNWALFNADCVEVAATLPNDKIHYSVYSPPFKSLYTYSNSPRDMGNSASSDEFWTHYKFLIKEIFRSTMPGRLTSVHCMNLSTSKSYHGYIGIEDFRGEIIREHVAAGFIFHSEVVIWKDPVTAMQRTKALGLLHKQVCKDSCMSRQGAPDYVVTFRKPGENPERVTGPFKKYIGDEDEMARCEERLNMLQNERKDGTDSDYQTRFSIDVWQRYASPVWMDINQSDTLQRDSARDEKDERHICPLQLQVIQRCIQLWSNPGDVVFSPFAGIGSEGYTAIKMGRKHIGIELKPSYFAQAKLNLLAAQESQETLDFTAK